jgi:hypothetical protein
MGNVTAVPEGKGTPEEKEEFKSFRKGEDNLFEAGIRVGEKGFYDPTAGSKYEKTERPVPTAEQPILATDPGQPQSVAKVTGRQSAVDKSELNVVSSRPTARKAAKNNSNEG